MERETAKPLTITATRELRAWLEARARENDRSLNKEVLRILNRTMESDRAKGSQA